MNDEEIPGFVIRAVPPEADLSGGGWVPEGEEDEDVEADGVEGEPVGEDDGGDRPD